MTMRHKTSKHKVKDGDRSNIDFPMAMRKEKPDIRQQIVKYIKDSNQILILKILRLVSSCRLKLAVNMFISKLRAFKKV